MRSKKNFLFGFLGLCLISAGTFFFIRANRSGRERIAQRKTELAAPTSTENLPTGIIPATETPAPSLTPTAVPSETPTEPPALSAEYWRAWPILPETVSPELKALYFEGIEAGNDPARFSKVGDSNTVMPSFLGCYDNETSYALGPYEELSEVIEHFQWSFSRNTRAAKNGATAYDMDVYNWYTDDICWPYESALNCEYRLFTPSIAFIGFGTNDALMGLELYEEHLRSLVSKTLERKIVPILLTKADDIEGDGSFNRITAQIALEFNVPLCNLWRAMSALPNQGLKAGDVHPTSSETSLCNYAGDDLEHYGWSVRNLTALQALDRVWRLLNE